MRVVAGSARGHRLQAPRGSATRPTSDKVRESIFNILQGYFVDGAVLDLFAGTGALGIEALSRGAREAVFVERRPAACQSIRANLAHTHFEHCSRLLCMPAERALPTLDEPFELILLDPPYAYPGIHGIIAMISEARVIAGGTVVVVEHSPRFAVSERYSRLVLQRQRVYGDTAVSLFVVGEDHIS